MGEDFFSSSVMFPRGLLQGDARKLLGDDTSDALEDVNGDTVSKLGAQVSQVAQSFQQPAEAGNHVPTWQSVTLPFVYQGAIEEARIYVKREPPRKTGGEQKKTGC